MIRFFGPRLLDHHPAQRERVLPILSAAPSEVDRAGADHRLYGVRSGADPCSAAEWARMAKEEIAAIHAAGRLPILVGGTGLYLRTLLDGIAPVPPIDPAIRADVRAASVGENLAALTVCDPVAAASLNPGDTTRIARALEVARSSGRTLASWQQRCEGGIGGAIALRPLVLLPPRGWLLERCDRRFAGMVDEGAVAEVDALLKLELDPQLPVMRAIGVPELGAMIRGELSREQAIAAGQLATRRYAKRQYTWFSNQPPADWPRFSEPLDDRKIDDALGFLMSIQNRSG